MGSVNVKKIKTPLKAVCAVAAVATLAACASHGQSIPNSTLPQDGTRTIRPMDTWGGIGTKVSVSLSVLLGDAAPSLGGRQVDAVNLGVLEIDGIKNGQTTVLASYNQPKIVNVLAHQDDAGEPISNDATSGVSYDQLRLVVDVPSSHVQLAGPGNSHHKLPINFLLNTSTSSSAAAGVNTTTVADGPGAVDMIVTQPFTLSSTQHQSVRLDFNAFESLALQQGNNLVSRPALFVAPVDDLGVIRGNLKTSAGSAVMNATVVAVAPDGSIGNTGFTDATGHFVIGTLRSGTYTLVIYNSYTNASGAQFTATAASPISPNQSFDGPTVTVTSGQTTHTGTIAD